MPTFRRSRGGRRGSTRVRTTWSNLAFSMNLPSTGALIAADLTPEPLSASEGRHGTAVCRRVIATFTAAPQDPVNNVPQRFGVGIQVLSQDAIANLQFLGPLDSGSDSQDWYYWTARGILHETGLGGNLDWEIDLKTSRRLRAGYGLIMVGQANAANTEAMRMTVGLRLLWAISN